MTDAPSLAEGRAARVAASAIRPLQSLHFRTVRPSLLDLRFCGDPFIVARGDGRIAIYLGDYCLTSLDAGPLDLPSLNTLFDAMRHRRPRHCTARRR